MKRTSIAILLMASMVGCGDDGGGEAGRVLENLNALVILQRAPRMGGVGDVFQYASYVPGARLVKLAPPTADGVRTTLCCEQFGAEFAELDIQSYDVSFDAKSIVFSGRLAENQRYGLFVLTLDDAGLAAGPPRQLATDPNRDYVYPIFAPGDRIVFVTNAVVEPGAKQHRDEYERGETTQLGSISADGTNEILGPRNLSHRVAPTMLRDGRILFTNWDHLGDMNAGHLMITNPDFTALREAFGKEGGRTNSYLKAVEIPEDIGDGEFSRRIVVIGTERAGTFQAGKLLDVWLGQPDEQRVWRMSESRARFTDLTPLVPEMGPSQVTVGRYYDAFPVRADDKAPWGARPYFVVSWADGPVSDDAPVAPDFGVYLFDSATGQRRPIFNDPATWDVLPKPLKPRQPPRHIEPSATNGISDKATLIGSLNVHDSSIATIPPGSVVRVRVLEGFSSEEGVPDDFGLTEHEGSALLGEAPVYSDGSWAALVPANVPIHVQAIDKFGMAIVNEPVWFSGRPGESRFCGGCHEDRARTTVIQPGLTQAIVAGAVDMDRPRADRRSMDFTRRGVVGVPWDLALQPIFDAKCVSCHDGDPSKPGNYTITFTDQQGVTSSFTFDLRGHTVSYGVGEAMVSGYSASHLSLMGPMMMELSEEGVTVSSNRPDGRVPVYVRPGDARSSALFEILNPPQLYPYDPSVRFVPGAPVHQGIELTEDEYYLLILMADSGGQFYSRENAPGASY